MIHPDYQYTPKLIPAMASIIANGLHPCVLGSRILGGYALEGGMPIWKYIPKPFSDFLRKIFCLARSFPSTIPGTGRFRGEFWKHSIWRKNSDDFVFDNSACSPQILWHGFTIAEVSCPTKYFTEASSINFRRSLKYGLGCLAIGLKFRLARMGCCRSKLFTSNR